MSNGIICNSDSEALLFDAKLVSEMLQLSTQLHQVPHDPVECKQQLLEGAARLIGADYGLCAIAPHGDFSEPVLVVSMMSLRGRSSKAKVFYRRPSPGITQGLLQCLVQDVGPSANRYRKAVHSLPRQIVSKISLDSNGTKAAIVLARRAKRPGFSNLDRAVVELFHTQMRWIYKIDLPLASKEVLSLSARPRQTLQYLLAGYSEKQAAAALNLSTNTVHHYVKHLYRHFRVSSRSELLSRWVRE
jgi:DNA-binding CsgD family transcriptional regulator